MKIILGIDPAGRYRSALTLLRRLHVARPEVTLLNVDEETTFPVSLPHTPVFSGGLGATASVKLRPSGKALLIRAMEEAQAAGFSPEAMYEAGNAADQLILQAHQLPADLVAIGSRDRGPLASALLGSVGHSLATTSTRSFLIAHGEVAPSGGVRCLFATDYSSYAEDALQHFLSWKMAGVKHLTVFNALEPPRDSFLGTLGLEIESVPPEAQNQSIQQAMKIRNFLESQGVRSSIQIRIGHAVEEIDRAMRETRSDLLVMGARGHGFTERLLLGSVAIKVADSARYPVLVVRPS